MFPLNVIKNQGEVCPVPGGVFSLNVIKNPTGTILWRGNSLLNGKPIVVIAIFSSKNRKTGDFVQTYILSDEKESPVIAANSGADESVCGDCIHRRTNGWGTCYVNLGQGPRAVYNAYKNGNYPEYHPSMLDDYFSGSIIRLGSYGDPAAVPLKVWRRILNVSEGWVGYTHQWKKCDPGLRQYTMASVETVSQQKIARSKGWKTFRIRNHDEELQAHEFVCPASHEANKRLKCEDCLACCGGEWTGQATPVIKVHGTHYKPVRFKKMQKLMRNKKKYRKLQTCGILSKGR